MRIEQLTCNIGAELLDVSLRDAAHDDALFDEIYAALLSHRVLFLRDQDISGADHVAFAERMGELEEHPVLPTPDATPGLVQIYKTPDKPVGRYENTWHHDNTWRPVPSKACVLRCVECPPVGGDTMWANMVAAYENLPDDMKTRIADLWASHSFLDTMSAIDKLKLIEIHSQNLLFRIRFFKFYGDYPLFEFGFDDGSSLYPDRLAFGVRSFVEKFGQLLRNSTATSSTFLSEYDRLESYPE